MSEIKITDEMVETGARTLKKVWCHYWAHDPENPLARVLYVGPTLAVLEAVAPMIRNAAHAAVMLDHGGWDGYGARPSVENWPEVARAVIEAVAPLIVAQLAARHPMLAAVLTPSVLPADGGPRRDCLPAKGE